MGRLVAVYIPSFPISINILCLYIISSLMYIVSIVVYQKDESHLHSNSVARPHSPFSSHALSLFPPDIPACNKMALLIIDTAFCLRKAINLPG